jgi:sporulation protein YlmC with PRC-barrel domain
MRLELNCPVSCSDGDFGTLSDVVVDPTTRRVTHLVVQPRGHHGNPRLVPVDRGRPGEKGIELTVTVADAQRFECLRTSAYLRLDESPADDPDWDVGIEEVYALPYYGASEGLDIGAVEVDPHVVSTYDRLPKGEVEIRRSSEVETSDGRDAGHVDGFLVDSDQQITHVVLQHGHLWRKRRIAVPIGAVDRVANDVVRLKLTKDEVGELAPMRGD